jgi:ATP phosphoribosyltransferase regulatory subunit
MSTTNSDRWMLPEGMFEAMPGQAQALESLRRELLDLFATWGYQYCMPPMVEHLDALLTGVGSTLERETFKLTDPAGGRLLGIRADMTTQAARIDANRLGGKGINRLCYVGSVLRDAPANAHRPRNPTQVGAELFGVDTTEADHEMLRLMVASLQQAGVDNLCIDIGHIGVYRAVINALGLSVEEAKPLYRLLQGRRVPEIHEYVQQANLDAEWQQIICALPSLHGDLAVLAEARELLATKVPEAIPAIEEIEAAAQLLAADGAISVHVDLIELRGYSYHTGLVFAALVPGVGSELARGGRYNSVGAAFGQARPATGFSADLGAVFDASQRSCDLAKAILAPAVAGNASLQAAIDALRATGEVVIEDVSGSADAAAHDCDRVLQEIEGAWQPVAV